mmetsp:Transcript_22976/g.71622  ORF Transcript_22976/g.71622 Transcript_22976/m.71622 type:complete len:230 (+) Transcript_22976:303-992(+)
MKRVPGTSTWKRCTEARTWKDTSLMESMALLESSGCKKYRSGSAPFALLSGKMVMVTLKRKPTRHSKAKALKMRSPSRSLRVKPTRELTKQWRRQMTQFAVICRVPTTVIITPVGRLPTWSTKVMEYFARGTKTATTIATKLTAMATLPAAKRHASLDVSRPRWSQTTSGGSQTTSRITRSLIRPSLPTHLSVPPSTGGTHSGVAECGSTGGREEARARPLLRRWGLPP